MRRLALAFALASCAHTPPPTPAAAAPAQAPAAAGPRVVDQGKFLVYLRGREIGDETFAISAGPGGREIKSRTELRLGAEPVVAEGALLTDDGWRPRSASFARHAGEQASDVTVERDAEGKLVQKVAAAGAEPKSLAESEASDLYLGEVSFSHLTPLCSMSGDDPKGVIIFPGVSLQMGRKGSLAEGLAGKHSLSVVPFIIAEKSARQLICDGDKAVIARYPDFGLTAVRSGYDDVMAAIAKAESHKPDVPAGIAELDRKVQSPTDGGAVLACSLLLPADRSATLPAVVFVSSSGPDDRDGDTPISGVVKLAIFKRIGVALAQAGVASLRCDDRGVAASTGSIAGGTLATVVADVAAQIAALRGESGIDGERIAIVAHSEGGLVAPLVAEKDPGVKALALLASPGRPLSEIILAQRDEANRQQGFNDAYVAREHKRMAGIYAAIRDGKPLPDTATDEERRTITPAQGWLASHFRVDPAKAVAKLKIPIFVAQGGKDALTSVKEDADRLRQALGRAGNKRSSIKVYAGLNHYFAAPKTGELTDYSDPDVHIDAELTADLVAFVKAAL